ncbi:MAG TPA: excinuclease ABC subunit UvrA, partial [Steroidobacteraceae bacterium]|nr:excinuclease ABC subunit UvrA [Steroidobacteraceae bacterium]
MGHFIRIRGARQNNLKGLDLSIPLNELVVVTGVSGSGKSSLVFDTLYAEGQRRYVETFSPYARQFLDRMDKPQLDSISGIPPAIAIDPTNPVRTTRSTVGTMTELNDHLKLLFARAASLFCECCGRPVRRDTAPSILEDLRRRAGDAGDPRLVLCFPVPVPRNFGEGEVRELLARQGYTRILEPAPPDAPAAARTKAPARRRKGAKADDTPLKVLQVIQDRFRLGNAEPGRVLESLETALRVGQGRLMVQVMDDGDPPRSREVWRYSSGLHCADCDRSYAAPTPSAFSFNSPIGACETCRGFGRRIGIDYGLVIPDENKSLREGAVRPWQTESYKDCQEDLEKHAKKRGVNLDRPWRELTQDERRWVIEGEGPWEKGHWYGIKRYFDWLESRAYKMHVRVLLSRYRSYTPCDVCAGARLRTHGLLWRVGSHALAETTLAGRPRFRPQGVQWTQDTLDALPGLCLHDLMLLPIERVLGFFRDLTLPAPLDQATDLLLEELRSRTAYLADVGLAYLTLDRQSRTLSGGEVQRINLTTALGTSLVNTLFVLDEPSIGLHPRDMQRVITVMKRLRDAGNSLLVVEHDPQIMLEADRIIDMGPGAGERGGQIVFNGTPVELRHSHGSLTADYLCGRRTLPVAAERPRVAAEIPGEVVAEARTNRWLEVRGIRHHNLKGIDLRVPLKRLACITGVSGSGKSTVVEDVLYPALLKYKGRPSEAPGEFESLRGAELIDDVVMVDQAPIGRTTRSNPASYVGAFDVIRELFALEPTAVERKYTAGTFSFNSGNGRCPTCSGNGFEHVEMQPGGGLIEQEQLAVVGDARYHGAGIGQMPRELQPLRLATGESRHRLPELHVLQADIGERRQPRRHFPRIAEELQRLRDRHLQHIGYARATAVGALPLDVEHLVPVARAIAVGAAQIDIRQELHLDMLEAVAAAGRAAPVARIEAEGAGRVLAILGRGLGGKQIADGIEGAHVARRVGTRGAADRALIDHHHLVDQLRALQSRELTGRLRWLAAVFQ